jgi:hypothetical protein
MATGEEHAAAVEETPEKKEPGTTELPAPSGWKKKVRPLDLVTVGAYLLDFRACLSARRLLGSGCRGSKGCGGRARFGSEGSGLDLAVGTAASGPRVSELD